MKKFCIIFLLSIIISVTALGFSPLGAEWSGAATPQTNTEYLRIHIRANSDSGADQAVKYLVRDEIVAYLTPIVAECSTRAAAVEKLGAALGGVQSVAENTLRKQGFSYGANAEVRTETFPTRVYGGYTLECGEYLALIVELGEANGANWWCVVYPPLCFVGEKNAPVIYKSKIAEIVENWKKSRGK
ncbi:MAG: stage II sporulation protein R [Clostridia bacterium]|nr:stage II sporulation protein R [Clostridia bacterium]